MIPFPTAAPGTRARPTHPAIVNLETVHRLARSWGA